MAGLCQCCDLGHPASRRQRLTAITQWAEATGNHLFLGEVGVTTDQTSLTALDLMLTYMTQHTDAWQGMTYWAGGPWWGNYMFSIEPQNGADKPQMAILQSHLSSNTSSSDGLIVSAGVVSSGVVVSSGATQDVLSGGTANATQVMSAGLVRIETGGLASGTTLSSGGTELLSNGATASATTINAGGQDNDYGSAAGTIVNGGGLLVAYGRALNAVVNSGGREFVNSGALDSAARVNSGGLEIVYAGGVATGTTISGGTLEIMSGGATGAGAVTFATSGGGTLRLDDSQHFAGLVAGFGQPDLISLKDLAFVSGATSATWTQSGGTSGTLAVTNGTSAVQITLLGQYVTGQFSAASDGHGGTVIADPPVTAQDTASALVTPHA
jgi:autotransporter passenger strand-loop-strand repeat protein